MVARAVLLVVVGLVGCAASPGPTVAQDAVEPASPVEPAKESSPTMDASPPSTAAAATPSERATPPAAIAIAAEPQHFSTAGAPLRLRFAVSNTGGAGSMELVALEYLGDAGPVLVAITWTLLGDVDVAGSSMRVEPGTRELALGLDGGALPPDAGTYRFRLRAVVDGKPVVAKASTSRVRREPLRR